MDDGQGDGRQYLLEDPAVRLQLVLLGEYAPRAEAPFVPVNAGHPLEHRLEGVDPLPHHEGVHGPDRVDVPVNDRLLVLGHGLGLYSARGLALLPGPLQDQVDREGEQVVDVGERLDGPDGARDPEALHLSANPFIMLTFFLFPFPFSKRSRDRWGVRLCEARVSFSNSYFCPPPPHPTPDTPDQLTLSSFHSPPSILF
jgi:hypothetical protein